MDDEVVYVIEKLGNLGDNGSNEIMGWKNGKWR